jgi:hypothetical protein
MRYSIHAALKEDINSGWVWINQPDFTQRAIVCIKNTASSNKVYSEVLRIDKNFLGDYNTKDSGRIFINNNVPSIVANEWYRKKLGGILSKTNLELEITSADNCIGRLFSCFQHPQIIVRVATWLALISVVEGILGTILGVISLCK